MSQKEFLNVLLRVTRNKKLISEWAVCRANNESIDLSKADLSDLDLREIDLSHVNLSTTQLTNANLSGTNLSYANLSYADMRRCDLASADCSHANLCAANLEGANMIDTTFDFAQLRGTRMGGSHMVGVSLVGADLENANLRGANLSFAVIRDANLKNVNVEDANLTKVDLTDKVSKDLLNFDKAIFSRRQEKPDERKRKVSVDDTHDDLFTETDSYRILGVAAGSSLDKIAKAYRKKAKEYHPDTVDHLGEKLKIVASREFQRIQKAYKSLTTHLAKPTIPHSLTSSIAQHEDALKKHTVGQLIEMIKSDPNNDVLHYNIGTKYLEDGLVELAITSFGNALRLNPRNKYAAHNLKLAKLMHSLADK